MARVVFVAVVVVVALVVQLAWTASASASAPLSSLLSSSLIGDDDAAHFAQFWEFDGESTLPAFVDIDEPTADHGEDGERYAEDGVHVGHPEAHSFLVTYFWDLDDEQLRQFELTRTHADHLWHECCRVCKRRNRTCPLSMRCSRWGDNYSDNVNHDPSPWIPVNAVVHAPAFDRDERRPNKKAAAMNKKAAAMNKKAATTTASSSSKKKNKQTNKAASKKSKSAATTTTTTTTTGAKAKNPYVAAVDVRSHQQLLPNGLLRAPPATKTTSSRRRRR